VSHRLLSIRAYAPSDLSAMIEIFRASVRVVARRDYSERQVMAWAPEEIDCAAWAKRYRHRQGWVAEVDGVLAGFSDLEPNGHLGMMYVHPDHQRCGVASALLGQIEEAARAQGLDRLYTEASITARPFFERRGFRLIAQQTVMVRGEELVNYRMEKPLGNLPG
jgi:putative acetyltransferase